MYQDFYNKNDDYVNQFKQKVAEQKIATIEERRHELARSRNNFLGTLAGIVLAGVVAWFVLAPQYKQAHKDVPTIHRPETAVKIKPENPGGMDIPNQDKDIYNLVEKKNVDNTVVENLLPTPEQPKLPDIVPEVTDVNATDIDEIVDVVAEENSDTVAAEDKTVPGKPHDLLEDGNTLIKDVVQKTEEIAKNTVDSAEQTVATIGEKVEAAVTETKDNAKETTKEAVKEAAKEPEKAAEKVAEKPAVVANGKWQVQLVASSNKTAVEKVWTDSSSKYADVLKGLPHEIQNVDLGAKGTMYRLRAGSFAAKEDAQKVCNALKAKGMNDCIVKER
jgi:cell division protein FtsN